MTRAASDRGLLAYSCHIFKPDLCHILIFFSNGPLDGQSRKDWTFVDRHLEARRRLSAYLSPGVGLPHLAPWISAWYSLPDASWRVSPSPSSKLKRTIVLSSLTKLVGGAKSRV